MRLVPTCPPWHDLLRSRPISLFGLARKEKRFLYSKEKRALETRVTCVLVYTLLSRITYMVQLRVQVVYIRRAAIRALRYRVQLLS